MEAKNIFSIHGSGHHEHASASAHEGSASHSAMAYRKLGWMGLLHFPFMYLIMFTMIDSSRNFFNNLNTAYMAVMMVAPMLLLMPFMMKEMYPNRRMNLLVAGLAIAVFGVFYAFMRQQSFVGDRQFLRSMIPHHSGAVLMCEKAKLENAEIQALCDRIIKSQNEEIAQMKAILQRM